MVLLNINDLKRINVSIYRTLNTFGLLLRQGSPSGRGYCTRSIHQAFHNQHHYEERGELKAF